MNEWLLYELRIVMSYWFSATFVFNILTISLRSQIQDESILRNMAAQYAAELASTLTLTPSSTSACSSSSDSSACSVARSSSSSAGSSSVQTPADAHYQQVFQQLRELWLEERMKLFPMPAFLLDDCGCNSSSGSESNNRNRNHSTMTPHRLKSSCSSTPAATTPNGCCPCDGIMMGNSGNGAGGVISFPTARSVPCLLHFNNNSSTSANNLINNSPCKSPERQQQSQQQQHQYLHHVIISNSSFNQHQQPGQSNNITANINVPKQTYTPGIYQVSREFSYQILRPGANLLVPLRQVILPDTRHFLF